MSLLRYVVAVCVAVPLFLMVGWPHPFYVTFLISCASFGAGAGVEALVRKARQSE